MPALNDAISQRRFKQVHFLMSYGIDLNTRNFAGKTALIQLCEFEPEEKAVALAKALVKKGAQIDKGDRKGRNSLVYAILNQREKLISFFLEEAANYDLNAKDFDGNTALSHAAVIGNLEIIRPIIRLLRKFRISVDVANNEGVTPLIQATKHGHISCAKFILSEGKASKHMRDNSWWKTASEWEECKRNMRLERQQKLGIILSLPNTKDLEGEDLRRTKSAPGERRDNFTGIRPSTSQSLHKPKNSQRQELERLFDVYKEQLSSAFRMGYTIKKSEETKTGNENLSSNFQSEMENKLEDGGSLEKSNLTGNSTRRLFAKGTAIVRFRKGSASRGQLSKTSQLSVSFPPGNAKPEEASSIDKVSPAKVELPTRPATKVSRPRGPVRSRSEIPYVSCSTSENEFSKESRSLQNNKLPKISLQERRRIDLTISTVLEEENED